MKTVECLSSPPFSTLTLVPSVSTQAQKATVISGWLISYFRRSYIYRAVKVWYKTGNPMHSAYTRQHQEYYVHASCFKNDIYKQENIQTRNQRPFCSKLHPEKKSFINTIDKYLIFCLCISVTNRPVTALKQSRPSMDRSKSQKYFCERSRNHAS